MLFEHFPDNWRTSTLEELCTGEAAGIQTGPFGSQLHQEDYVEDGTPIITVEHLLENRISHKNTPRVSQFDRERLAKYTLRVGDIVFSRVGSVDRRSIVRSEESGWLFSGRCLRVRPNKSKIDPNYLSHYLGHPLVKGHLRSIAVGATMPSLNTKLLSGIEVLLPISVTEQKAIAHILGTLDDKIELNRKTNETLETMAKALFKSWFVDFDPVRAKIEGRPTGLPAEISDLFPDSFEDSELGEIPSGWVIRSVSEITERVAMGPFGSNIKVSTFVESGVPVISGAHLKGVLLQDADYRFVTEEHSLRLANSCVSSGDVVFTHAGTIGQVALIPENSEYIKYVLSQRQFYARPLRRSLRHYLLMFFHSEKGKHELLSNTSQTGVPSIARPATFLKSIRMPLPGEDLLILFDQMMSDLVTRMRSITGNTSNYVSIRDTLLPKLISGEIRIPDAEKMLEEVDI